MFIHLIQQFVNGLSVGMVYALMAIGFTLIFGVLNVVNFAHGEVFTIGGFAGLVIIMTLAPALPIVLLIVLFVGALSGFCLERVAFKPFRRFQDEASIKFPLPRNIYRHFLGRGEMHCSVVRPLPPRHARAESGGGGPGPCREPPRPDR